MNHQVPNCQSQDYMKTSGRKGYLAVGVVAVLFGGWDVVVKSMSLVRMFQAHDDAFVTYLLLIKLTWLALAALLLAAGVLALVRGRTHRRFFRVWSIITIGLTVGFIVWVMLYFEAYLYVARLEVAIFVTSPVLLLFALSVCAIWIGQSCRSVPVGSDVAAP